MPMKRAPILVAVLAEPRRMAGLDRAAWQLLLRQALRANLSASLHALAVEHGVLDTVPASARAHLAWAATLAARHLQAVDWEIRMIGQALAPLGLPVLLLKGGAYAAARLPAGRGRLFSDIDILVPRAALPEVESALMLHGWIATHHDAYDQRYYRQWMHEIPPMVHARRDTAIDVHHTILPLTARARPDPDTLRAAACAVPGRPGVQVLSAPDMLIHSATHLFYDGEFGKGLRDLYDIHRLLQERAGDAAFWEALPARARALGLGRPLYYALRYSSALLGTPVPATAQAAADAARPAPPLRWLMDQLFRRALMPDHPSCGGAAARLARALLYVRGNWLRMPPALLARHLFHKAVLSPRAEQVQA